MKKLLGFFLCGGLLAITIGMGYGQTNTGCLSSNETTFSSVIETERGRAQLPRGLIESIIWHESKFDEKAYNPEKESRCYKKAKTKAQKDKCASKGLMQIRAIYHGDASDAFDNIRRGVRGQLGPCWKKYRSVWGAAYCYNGSGERARKYANAVSREFKIWSKLS